MVKMLLLQPKNRVRSFVNYTLKDVENNFNESFSDSLVKNIFIPAGSGYLFYIAPAVKYGGRIKANETISAATALTAPLTIASGVTLTISSIYTVNSDITVEDGEALYLQAMGI